MRRASLLALLALLATLGASIGLAGQTKSAYDTISYSDLGNIVRAERGKVVVVYFWAHY